MKIYVQNHVFQEDEAYKFMCTKQTLNEIIKQHLCEIGVQYGDREDWIHTPEIGATNPKFSSRAEAGKSKQGFNACFNLGLI